MKIILLGPGAYSGIYQGGLDFFSFLGVAQHPLGPLKTLKSKDTGPGET